LKNRDLGIQREGSPVPKNDSHYWWQTGVIYQIYLRSFRDTAGNGVGDLVGIIEKLDYLSETLGVDAIWISPFYPSPMADFGYDVTDYTGVDPLFGDMETLERLVAEIHARGLKVIIDMVPNHTSDQHPWFIESRRSRDNDKHDWYIWHDGRPDGTPPNNWLSNFGGSAWKWEEGRQQFYLHSFLEEQPDLNWRNPAVKDAMFDVYRFWLHRGIDGFRIDVAHYIMKDPELRDNPPNPNRVVASYLGETGAGISDSSTESTELDSLLPIYSRGHADVHDVYRELRQLLDGYGAEAPRMMIGEIHVFEPSLWARYYGDQLDEFHLPFNFTLIGVDWNAEQVQAWVDAIEDAVPEGAWPNWVLGNHDEHRLASRFGRAQARTAAMLLLTLRGTPTLYYGDEIGMTDVPIPPEREQDPFGKRVPGMGRDSQRTPMQWNNAPNAGFSAPDTPETWLPLAEDYQEINVACQLDKPKSLLALYRRLLAFRRRSPALRWGRHESLRDLPSGCFVYWRKADGQRLLVALNFTDHEQQLHIGAAENGRIVLSTYLDREEELSQAQLTLRSHEGVIIAVE
jgi:alpha-glucosidase